MEAGSAMLPPPPSSTMLETGKAISRKRAGGVPQIDAERGRRLKMAQMYTQLRTTVPGVLPQASRDVIVNETICYIQELEKKKRRLEELKEATKAGALDVLPCGRNCSVAVTVSGNLAFFGIQSVAQRGLFTVILKVFCKHRAEVLAANVSVNSGKLMLAITALVQGGDGNGNGTVEKIKREIVEFVG